MQSKIKVLVVDDLEQNLLLISRFVTKLGHQVVTAKNGEEAIRCYQEERPDVILMDIMMPGMDGYEATARIKALETNKWVPVVFLSAMTQDESLVRGLDVGGDDYLTKPVNLVVLKAKINAMLRIAELQEYLAEKNDKLESYYFMAEEEKRVAKHLMEHIINAEKLHDESLEFFTEPAQGFNGDLLAAARSPGNILHVLLADGTGHGLSAAINVMLLIQPFYAMTEKGFSLPSIVEEMNRKLKTVMPADRFVAATFVSIDMRNHLIEVWNGGNPALIVLDDEGQIIKQFRAKHLPLGILNENEFRSYTEIYQWERPVQVVLCSDGVTEAENTENKMFGIDGVTHSLQKHMPAERLQHLIYDIKTHLNGRPAVDDLSIALIHCPMHEEQAHKFAEQNSNYVHTLEQGVGYWKFELGLSAHELKYIDVVPIMLNVINEIHIAREHASQLFLIVSELYNNALDHGILKLNSHLKSQPEGMDRYLIERKQRLQNLEQGSIDIRCESVIFNQKACIKIHVRDSGEGFDFHHVEQSHAQTNPTELMIRPFGRGIHLVRHLASHVQYLGRGNEVVVYYELS